MTLSPSIRLLEPAIRQQVVEEGAQGAAVEEDLDVVAADWFPPPFVVDLPGVLDARDAIGAFAVA
jgi:hypothetical protein